MLLGCDHLDTIAKLIVHPRDQTYHPSCDLQSVLSLCNPLLPSLSYHPPLSHPLPNLPFPFPFFFPCSFSSFSLMARHPALHRSWGKWLWNWFCGLSGVPQQALSPAEKAVLEQKLTSIEEEPVWRRVCNINAIILLVINVFLWGYFA